MNVHVFDNKLHDSLIPYRSKLLEISNLPNEVKISTIRGFKPLFSVNANRTLDMICQLNGNQESTNNLNALDVLYLIMCNIAKSESDFINNVDEQLSDVVGANGGTCPSGRTTRLIQLYIQYIESKDMQIIPNVDIKNETKI